MRGGGGPPPRSPQGRGTPRLTPGAGRSRSARCRRCSQSLGWGGDTEEGTGNGQRPLPLLDPPPKRSRCPAPPPHTHMAKVKVKVALPCHPPHPPPAPYPIPAAHRVSRSPPPSCTSIPHPEDPQGSRTPGSPPAMGGERQGGAGTPLWGSTRGFRGDRGQKRVGGVTTARLFR